MRKMYGIGVSIILIICAVFILRFFIGGDEDTWICEQGRWIAHGKPVAPIPTILCGSAPTVTLFFQNIKLSPNDCSLVYPVSRTFKNGELTIKTVLTELFKGPTAKENTSGFSSVFTSTTTPVLRQVFSKNGIVYIDLNDIRGTHSAISSSCGSAAFFSSVEETLRIFYGLTELPKVRYAINGDPIVFYEWVQSGCDTKEKNCDSTPFQ